MTSERSRDAVGRLTGTSASSDGLLRSDRPLTWNLRKCPLSKQFTLESGMTKRRPDRTQVDRRRMAEAEPYQQLPQQIHFYTTTDCLVK